MVTEGTKIDLILYILDGLIAVLSLLFMFLVVAVVFGLEAEVCLSREVMSYKTCIMEVTE